MRFKALVLFLSILCMAQSASAAIAFDVAAGATGAGSSLSGTIVNSGTFMLGYVSINNLVDTPTCTWNGDAMTLFETSLDATAYKNWGFYLDNPDTGSHSMSCSGSSAIIDMRWLTYTGVDSIEAHDKVNQGSGTSLTCSITTITANSWLNQYVLADQGGPLAASTGSTLRDAIRSDSWGFFDSNGPKATPGSYNMVTTMANGASTCIIAVLKPEGTPPPDPGPSGPFDISTTTATTTAQLIGTVQMGLGIIIVIMMVYLCAYLYNSLFRKKQWQH